VFITPTKLQLDILSKILSTDKLDRFIGNGLTDSLVLIGMLQKICNSPILLKATADKNKAKENQGGDVTNSVVREALECLPRKIHVEDVSLSGKIAQSLTVFNQY
jgi:DNA repair and recombination protein RAD54B